MMPSNLRPGLSFRLPLEERETLRALARERNVAVTTLVEDVLRDYVAAGARLASPATANLVLRPMPDLVEDAREMADANAESLTTVIRAGIQTLSAQPR